jgi:hypothetical protein
MSVGVFAAKLFGRPRSERPVSHFPPGSGFQDLPAGKCRLWQKYEEV